MIPIRHHIADLNTDKPETASHLSSEAIDGAILVDMRNISQQMIISHD